MTIAPKAIFLVTDGLIRSKLANALLQIITAIWLTSNVKSSFTSLLRHRITAKEKSQTPMDFEVIKYLLNFQTSTLYDCPMPSSLI